MTNGQRRTCLENDRYHQGGLWHGSSHVSRVRSRLIFLYSLPVPPQTPAPPHGSPTSPPLTNGPGGGASGRSPGARASWRLFWAGPTASIRPYQMEFRWPLFSCKGQWLLPDDKGVVQTPKTWKLNQQRKRTEKKRKPHAALPLCHQILLTQH